LKGIDMQNFEQLAIQAALKKLLSQDYFDICTVDKILAVTRSVPDGKVYRSLHLLHCVNYMDMPRELLEELPMLLAEVFRGPLLDMPGMNFVIDNKSKRPSLAVTKLN
jgi:hypothetical protein